MSTQNNNAAAAANDTLVGSISAKQYFTKLASVNVHPANDDEALRLLKMGDAIHNALEEVSKLVKSSEANSTKKAIDAVFEHKVEKKASKVDKIDVASYLKVQEIVDAAKALLNTEGGK